MKHWMIVAVFVLVATLALPVASSAQSGVSQGQSATSDSTGQSTTVDEQPSSMAAPASPAAEPAEPAIAVSPVTTEDNQFVARFLEDFTDRTEYNQNPYWSGHEDWNYISVNNDGE